MQNQEQENKASNSRVIKFRAWDKSTKAMKTSKKMVVHFDGSITPFGYDAWRDDDFILMQLKIMLLIYYTHFH